MGKYHINKEFLPYLCFAPPIKNAKIGGRIGLMMKPPRWSVRCKLLRGIHGNKRRCYHHKK